MCPPEYYEVSYSINPWMVGNIGKVDKLLAEKQWTALYRVLEHHADVELIQPHRNFPDMVFTANGGLVVPERNTFIVSKMLHQERRNEQFLFGQWAESKGYVVHYFDQSTRHELYFEGQGDCLRNGNHFVFGYGQRSTSQSRGVVFDIITGNEQPSKYSSGVFKLRTSEFYHLDTCYLPLHESHIVAFRAAFDQHMLWGTTQIVSAKDAANFVCNAVVIDKLVVMPLSSPSLKNRIEEWGYTVVQLDMSEFIKAGGACKCLTLTLDLSLIHI